MNNAQRKKKGVLYSFQEGYLKPPYPYSSKVRGYPSNERYIRRPYKGPYNRVKLQFIKFYAGCRICDGNGHTWTYYGYEDCVCVAKHSGTYSNKAYRV